MSAAPPASVVFVGYDDEGRVLLARRSAGARDEAGRWDCGAGAVEPGETPEQALRREVREEYAAEPLELRRIGTREVVRDGRTEWTATVFAVRLDPGAVRIGEPDKLSELGWFDPQSLPSPRHSQLGAVLALYSG